MTTTAIIILSALLGGSICINIAASVSKKRLADRIDSLRNRLAEQDADRHSVGTYWIGRFEERVCKVYRTTYRLDGEPINTLIKAFDTDDADYNYNEAVELVDNLKRTLCYD